MRADCWPWRCSRGPRLASGAVAPAHAASGLELTPRPFNFPRTIKPGETQEHEFTVTNIGSSELVLTRIRLYYQPATDHAEDLSITKENCMGEGPGEMKGRLKEGEKCKITVAFTPKSYQSSSAILTAQTATAMVECPIMAQAKGVEFEWGSSPELNVGTAGIGSEVFPVKLARIRATGSEEVTGVEGPVITGPGKEEFEIVGIAERRKCEDVIRAEGVCSVKVEFHPDGPGKAEAMISVKSDLGEKTLRLIGTGEPPAATLDQATLAFGSVDPGSQSGSQHVTLTNTAGKAPLDVSSDVEIAGTQAGEFQLAGDNCPAKVAPGGSCEIAAAFKPTGPGLAEASLVVKTNAPGGDLHATLTGNGTSSLLDRTPPTGHEPTPTPPSTNPNPTNPNPKPEVTPTTPPNGSTALFDGNYLYLRVKCPKRFKPQCSGKAFAFTQQTKRARSGRGAQVRKAVTTPITGKVVASQKAGKWKVVRLPVLAPYRSMLKKLAKQKGTVRLAAKVSAPKFKGGKAQNLQQKYRVLEAGK